MDGRRVFLRNNLGNQGTFILPQLPYGIYILRINLMKEGAELLKLFQMAKKPFQ